MGVRTPVRSLNTKDWREVPMVVCVAYLRAPIRDPLAVGVSASTLLSTLIGDVSAKVSLGLRTRSAQPKEINGRIKVTHLSDWCSENVPARLAGSAADTFALDYLGVGSIWYNRNGWRNGGYTLPPLVAMSFYLDVVRPGTVRKPLDLNNWQGGDGDCSIQDVVKRWFEVVDRRCDAASGIAVCDRARDLDYGSVLIGTYANRSWRMECETRDWWTSSDDDRLNRVRSPAWGIYLSKKLSERVPVDASFLHDYNVRREPESSQLGTMLGGGGSLFIASGHPMDVFACQNMLEHDAIKSIVWLWQRLRRSGLA